VRQPALGISFFFNDYTTPQRIKASSLSSVLANKQKAKVNEMDAGIGISYFQGLSNHVDFVATFAGSFVQYDLEDRLINNQKFLMETDASINLKLLTEKYWLTPFASIGAGISKYGVYYGAFVPVGLGLKLNIFDEAHLFYNTQYRIPVTPTTAEYHFMHGIGIAGIIGSKK
jgi:OmpA-OmpF porin, OOP family